MTDDRNPLDGNLSARLRAHENRVPGGRPPDLDARRRRAWAPVALVGAAGVVAGGLLVVILLQPSRPPTGDSSPSPSGSPVIGGTPTPSGSPVIGPTPAPSVLTEVTVTAMDGLLPGDKVVEVGMLGDVAIAVGQGEGALGIWTRHAGDSWTSVTDLEPIPESVDGGYPFTDLAIGKDGAVAVGYWFLANSEFGTPRIDFTPGGDWTPALGPSNPAGGECGLITAVTATPTGWVAVGGSCGATGESGTGQAWISTNGTQWSEVPIAGLAGAFGVAVGSDRVVAVGYSDGGTLSAVSVDGGSTWQLAEPSPDITAFRSVVYHDGLFVALGSTRSTGKGTARLGIWVSSDGVAWENAYLGDATHGIEKLVEVGDQVVAVGGQFPSGLWTPEQGGKPLADTVEVWTSTDGRTWDGPRVAYAATSRMFVTGATVDSDGKLVIIASGVLGADGTRQVPILIEGPILDAGG